MPLRPTLRPATALAVTLAACAASATGYDAKDPTKLTCPCDDPRTCYEAAADLDTARGETAETGEQLLLLAQCACFEGSMAGCNTLGHFVRDHVKACDRGESVATSCTISGFVYRHGVGLPRMSGASVHHDPAAAHAAFDRACRAGSAIACAQQRSP